MTQHHNKAFKIISMLTCTLFLICAILLYNNSNKSLETILNSYDYIIVGGGTAGCVLAAKLSENKNNSVLLIEAGGYFNFLSSVPLFAAMLQGSKYDWSFKTEPQTFSSFGLHNQSQSLPRGKGLGGSNQINFMVHGEDILNDIEKLKTYGILGWEYKKLKPYFQNLFQNEPRTTFEANCMTPDKSYSANHNSLPSAYTLLESKSDLGNILANAVRELKQNDIKFESAKSTIANGQRWTSYNSHIKPIIEQDNLHILLNAYVSKVLFQKKHAIGIEVIMNNIKKQIYSRLDIILSAGAINSPHILLLSGIGPKHILKKHRINTLVDLPGVGRNLHDHLNMPLYVSIAKSISLTSEKILQLNEFWNYALYRTGVFSRSPISGFVKKSNIGILLFGMGSTDEKIMREIANFKIETFESMFPFYKNSSQEGFVLLSTCLKPSSRGNISLKNSNPRSLPIIHPQYLSKYKDIECMSKAVKLAEDIMNTTMFRDLSAEIHWPNFENCTKSDQSEYLECIVRTGALTAHHPGGTCQMGDIEKRLTVVDNFLRVKGVIGLRIMDASILPEPLSTFPNSILMAMAEYAADLIMNDTKNKSV